MKDNKAGLNIRDDSEENDEGENPFGSDPEDFDAPGFDDYGSDDDDAPTAINKKDAQ